MAFITGKHIPRRTVLRGLGATVALPFLDAMVPARSAVVEDGQRRGARSHAAGLHRDGARRGRQQRMGRDASTSGRRPRPDARSISRRARSARSSRSAST